MTTAKKLISAAGTAAGAAGGGTYVDDVFSTYLYEGTGGSTTATSTSAAFSGTHTHNVQFSSDGLYVATHLPNSSVYISNLTSPYDLGTITSSTNFSYTSQTTNSQSSRLSDDGTKAYVSDGATDVIFQYDLSTAYDASSASYASKSLDISGQVTNPRGFFFKPDGKSLFVVCANNDDIYQYTLSTAWDISTGSYASKSVSTGGETNPYNVFFNDTGTVMIICGSQNGLTEFALSTAWDVSTASATGTTGNPDTYGTTTLTFAADFADSGTRLAVIDSSAKIGVGDLPGSYDIDTIGDGQAIRNGIDLASEGGLVWIKQRDATDNNYMFDTERGTTYSIFPNSNYGPHVSYSGGLTSFNSNGFGVGSQSGVNSSGGNNVAWTFRKAPGFFDVVTWTGNGVSGREIAHNLGSTPGMMLVKATSDTSGWAVYHRSLGATKAVLLDTSDTPYTLSSYWNDTEPTDSVFTLGSGWNVNGIEFVAYVFAHDAQDFGTNSDEAIIKCGSYTGNGSNNGPTVDLGFEPQWIILKDTTSAYNWYMFDTMRGWSVVNASELRLTLTTENSYLGGAYNYLKPLPNGFQITDAFSHLNTNGNEYIYMAIRRPHKPASEFNATDLFDIFTYKDNTLDQSTNPIQLTADRQTGGPSVLTDMWWHALRGTTYPAGKSASFFINSRLQGPGKGMLTSAATKEPAGDAGEMKGYDRQTGVEVGPNGTYYYYSSAAGNRDHVSYYFRRAPGFFDVVAYTGTGVNRSVPHNLGVAPELLIVKSRNNNDEWTIYSNALTSGYSLYLPSTAAETVFSNAWQSTTVDSTNFYVGTNNFTNRLDGIFIAYMFATVAGISKVGTYSGTGAAQNIDCGFSNGARFVLIKAYQGRQGDWYVWDSERGIVSGNDPYLLLNTNAAEATSTDYIDPLSSGFTITSSAPVALNASDGEYLFLAIA